MAKKLSKTGIVTNQLVLPHQVTQSIDAFTGEQDYDINLSGSLAITGSTTMTLGGLTIIDSALGPASLNVTNITASNLSVINLTSSFVTASTVYTSGSNIFGDEPSDTHTFIGGVTASGVISASGDIYAPNIEFKGNSSINSFPNGTLTVSHNNSQRVSYSSNDTEFSNREVIINSSAGKLTVDGIISSSGAVTASSLSATTITVPSSTTGYVSSPIYQVSDAGSSSNPTIYFSGRANTGIYWNYANNSMLISSAGSEVAEFKSAGLIVTGTITGDGAGLTNIPASSIVGLNLSQITGGTYTTASVSTNLFRVEAGIESNNLTTEITSSIFKVGDLNLGGNATKFQLFDSTRNITIQGQNQVDITTNNLVIDDGNSSNTGKVTLYGSLTASGDISSSGVIFGSQVETPSILTDTITEKSSATGVTIEGTLLKDNDITSAGAITASSLSATTITSPSSTAGYVSSNTYKVSDAGSAASPTIYFSGRLNTGIYWNYLNNSMLISSNGSEVAEFKSTGLTVTGEITGDGAGLTNIPASSIVGLNLSEIKGGTSKTASIDNSGFRVNTDTIITGSLHTTTDITSSGKISSPLFEGTGITTLGNTSNNTNVVAGTQLTHQADSIQFKSAGGGSYTFNEGTIDGDLNFYDFDEQDLVKFDAGESRVGIKTSSPTAVLDVNGNIKAIDITASGDISSSGVQVYNINITSSTLGATYPGKLSFDGTSTPTRYINKNVDEIWFQNDGAKFTIGPTGGQTKFAQNPVKILASSGQLIVDGTITSSGTLNVGSSSAITGSAGGSQVLGLKNATSQGAILKIHTDVGATNRPVGIYFSASGQTAGDFAIGLNRQNQTFAIGHGAENAMYSAPIFEMGATGAITASGDISCSISSGVETTVTATTGSFNHIITDGETLEFRDATTRTKVGALKFDPTNGLEVKDSAGNEGKLKTRELNISSGGSMVIDAANVNFNNLPISDPEISGRLYMDPIRRTLIISAGG